MQELLRSHKSTIIRAWCRVGERSAFRCWKSGYPLPDLASPLEGIDWAMGGWYGGYVCRSRPALDVEADANVAVSNHTRRVVDTVLTLSSPFPCVFSCPPWHVDTPGHTAVTAHKVPKNKDTDVMRRFPFGDVTLPCFFHASEFRFDSLVSCFLRMFACSCRRKSPPASDVVSNLRYLYERLFILTSGGWTCFDKAYNLVILL